MLRWGATDSPSRLSVAGWSTLIRGLGPNIWVPPFANGTGGTIAPGLCLEYTVSSDGRVYTVAIDPEARFSDGTKVTAADLKFSFEFLAHPDSGNAFADYQTPGVVGQGAVKTGTAREMAGLRVVDAETLEVTLDQAYNTFLYLWSTSIAGVYQRKNIEEGGADWDSRPTVSCGPYMIDRFDRNTGEVDIVRNPYWWREQPTIERIEYRLVPDSNSLVLLWESEGIDLFELVDYNLLQRLYAGPMRTALAPNEGASGTIVLSLDTSRPPTADIDVRRALLMATDVGTIVPAILGDVYPPAYGLADPATPGLEGGRPPFFDPAGARAALAASTYGGPENLPPIAIAIDPQSTTRPLAEALQQGWQDVLGIAPAILPADPAFDREQLGAQVHAWSPFPLYRSPGDDLNWSYRAGNLLFGDGARIADDDVDGLLLQALALPPDQISEQGALYRQAEDLILDRAYFIPLHFIGWWYVVQPRIANATFRPDLSTQLIDWFIAER